MAEWGDNPVTEAVAMSDAQYKELLERVIEMGISRKKQQGTIDEPDFLSGAMVTMEALGIKCPMWPIAIMTGQTILEEKEDAESKS